MNSYNSPDPVQPPLLPHKEVTTAMRRRQFVKGLLAASVSGKALLSETAANQVAPATPRPTPPVAAPAPAPGPVPWMRGLLEARPLPIGHLVPDAFAEPIPRFFSDEQRATLRQFCEILLPPMKGYPGALDAGVPEFLDFLISVSPSDRQQMYKDGLDRLDAEAKKKFGIPFSDVNAGQADELIRPWLRPWMSDHPPREPFEHFINLAHADIRTATINSQQWNDSEIAAGKHPPGLGLYWFPVEADLEKKYLPHDRGRVDWSSVLGRKMQGQ